MTKHQTKIPKRRFKGFTGEWEEKKLGEVVSVTMGQSPNSVNYTDNPSDHVLVQGNADMNNNRVVPRVWTTQVTKQADKGDLILSVRAPVGDVGKTDYDVVIGRGVAALKGNEFIYQSLVRMKEYGYWTRLSTGSTFESINSNDIKEAIIMLPSLEEQQKIGEFFSELDERIELQKSKVKKMKELKKAYLSEMFPAEGETTPKRRFKEFIKNDISIFKKCYLKDLGNIVTGATPKTSVAEYWENGDILFVSPGDMLGNKYVKDTEKKVTSSGAASVRIIPAKSVMVTCIGSTIGKMALSSELCVTNQQINTIIPNEEYDSNFIYYALCNNRNLFEELKGTTAVPIINKSDFQNLQIMLPSKEEQKKIGEFFSELDEIIELHKEKLKKLQDLKQAYLNELLI